MKIMIDDIGYTEKPTGVEVGKITNRMYSNVKAHTKDLTPTEIAKELEAGKTIVCSILNKDKEIGERGYKTDNHFESAELFVVDIDNKTTIDGKVYKSENYLDLKGIKRICKNAGIIPCIVCESFTSREADTNGNIIEKYHAFFKSDTVVTDIHTAKNIYISLLEIFKPYSDTAVSNVVRLLFGTKKDTKSRITYISDTAVNSLDTLLQGYYRIEEQKAVERTTHTHTSEKRATHGDYNGNDYNSGNYDIDLALSFISADRDYNSWFSISSAYKGAGGNFEFWRAWCLTGNYDGKQDLQKMWNEIAGTPTAKTLTYYVEQDNPQNHNEVLYSIYNGGKEWQSKEEYKKTKQMERLKNNYSITIKSAKSDTLTIANNGEITPADVVTDEQQQALTKTYERAKNKEAINIQYFADFLTAYGYTPKYNILAREIEIPINAVSDFKLDFVTDKSITNYIVKLTDIASGFFKNTTKEKIIDYVNYIATCGENNAFNPIISACEEWSRSGRAVSDAPLQDLYNIMKIPATDTLTRNLIYKWLMQCISLQYNGTADTHGKVQNIGADGILVLTGGQGIGKSLLCERLTRSFDIYSRSDTFGRGAITLEDKDNIIKATKRFIFEFAEIEHSFSKTSAEKFKDFITAYVDEVRPPYGHTAELCRRHTSFIATCNNTDYLKDTTGNRRFWTVECTERFNIEKLLKYDFSDLWYYIYTEVQKQGVNAFRITTTERESLDELNKKHLEKLPAQQEIEDILTDAVNNADAYIWQYSTVTAFAGEHTALNKYNARGIGKAVKMAFDNLEIEYIRKTVRINDIPTYATFLPMRKGTAIKTEIKI